MALYEMAKDKEKEERCKVKQKSRNTRPKYGTEWTACMRKVRIMKDAWKIGNQYKIQVTKKLLIAHKIKIFI